MKRIIIILCFFAVALIVISFSTPLIISNEQVWSSSSLARSVTLTPSLDRTDEFNVTTPGSIIQIIINSNSTLTVELSRDNKLELRWVGTEFTRNVQIANVGVWSIRILNNNSETYAKYDSMINLKEPHSETKKPYLWLQTPLFLAGGFILGVTGTTYLLSKTTKRKSTLLTILVSIILVLFIFSYQIGGLLLGTSHPWMVCEGTSMEPAINYGDLAIVAGENPKNLSPEDIIVYQEAKLSPDSPEISTFSVPVVHRILYVNVIDNQSYFKTKGDNNAQADDWIVPQQGLIGKVIFVVPKIGFALLILERLDVKVFLVCSILLLLFIWPAVKRRKKDLITLSKKP